MGGHVFVAQGDITQLSAHAITYSASILLGRDAAIGLMYSAFAEAVPGFAEAFHQLPAPCEVGDAFWLPRSAAGKPIGVVVVASTDGTPSLDHARLAVRGALRESVKRLREMGKSDRLLIALPSIRAGKGGDRQQQLASAQVQIQTASEVLHELPGVDAAFISYTPQSYHTYLEARRQVLGAPSSFSPTPYAGLEDVLRAGECVLFIGAGLSLPAGMPSWKTLIERLAADLKIQTNGPLDFLDVAQWYREHEAFGLDRLVQLVRQTFADPQGQVKPTLAHYLLLSLPVRQVITTNYDNLIERSLTALHRYPIKIIKQEEVVRTGQGDGVYVVKLHGDAESATRGGDIVLARDDYDSFFSERPAMALLLEGLLLNQSFFFVGYSLSDPNFRQVYARIATMLQNAKRPAFATTFDLAGDTGAYLVNQWKNKGLDLIGIPGSSVEEQGYQFIRFLDQLADRVATHSTKLFLAPDVQVSGPLENLRYHLIEHVGHEVESLCAHAEGIAHPDVRRLAQVLEFLTNQGWRPTTLSHGRLWRLWERLAEQVPDRTEKRRLLSMALRYTDTSREARRIYDLLRELDPSDPSEPPQENPNPPESKGAS